jgi:hypothetical protein
MGRSGGGDEADVFQFGGLGEFLVGFEFVRGEVEHENAIGSGLGGIVVKAIETVCINGIEIGKEDDGDLGNFPEVGDQFEDVFCGGAGIEGALGGALDDGSVCERVGEGDSELDDIDSGGIERLEDSGGFLEAWVSGADVSDEGGVAVFLELCEGGIDSIGHIGTGGTMWWNSAGLATHKPRADLR